MPILGPCEIATDREPRLRGPAVDQLIAILRVRICPWADAPNSVEYIRTSTYDILSSDRQNVVTVGTGRSSRSAKFTTSSELLYLLNLLYNMLSECCDDYKLIQLYQKSSVWCFAFSHTSTFELIPELPWLSQETW